MAADIKLQREIFETSRELEYFSEKELRGQIGHDKNFWPMVILRELIDNSLDACEKTGTAPLIEVNITDHEMTVQDNGSGIPLDIIRKSQDYSKRISDKAYYVSPTRGQMGNALKVIYAFPFVTNPMNPGFVEIGSHGEMHHISITVDRIAGRPVMTDKVTPFVRNGTFVRINSTSLLPSETSYFYNSPPTPQELIEGYTAFNPHVTFILNGVRYEATEPGWEKWTTDQQTSIHWYSIETLSDLIAGYLYKERRNGQNKKTVREFIKEFRGLSSSAKQKKVTENYFRSDLSVFEKNGDIDRESLKILLWKMQAECVAPKPAALGIIGKDHLMKWMLGHGAAEPSITYVKKCGIDNVGLPYIFEGAFAVKTDNALRRTQITGLNWSPVIGEPPDPSLRQAIQDAMIKGSDPVIFLAHIARPRFEFMDRGKTKVEL